MSLPEEEIDENTNFINTYNHFNISIYFFRHKIMNKITIILITITSVLFPGEGKSKVIDSMTNKFIERASQSKKIMEIAQKNASSKNKKIAWNAVCAFERESFYSTYAEKKYRDILIINKKGQIQFVLFTSASSGKDATKVIVSYDSISGKALSVAVASVEKGWFVISDQVLSFRSILITSPLCNHSFLVANLLEGKSTSNKF